MQGQIEIVRVQKDAEAMQKAAEANAKAELYKALASVAKTNPEQASAVVVAMAVQGVGAEGEGDDSSVVPLQPLQNEGLEFARVFAAPVMNMTTAVATAYINADVAKTQSDNAAQVQINDAMQDSRIVEAVAGVGMAAAESSGMFVQGDNYTLTDSAAISQDQISTVTETTTTAETTTTTNTTTDMTDAYNTQTLDYDDNTNVTINGNELTLAELVTYLEGLNTPFVLTVGDDVIAESDGEGEEEALNCVPSFDGYQCSDA